MNMLTPFEFEYKGENLQIIPRKVGMDYVYIIDFPTRRPPLMLTKAHKEGGKAFWTTVPEERDKMKQEAVLAEAAVLGELISKQYQEAITS